MLPDPDRRDRLVAWTIWCDGLFELTLGVALATSTLTGLLGRLALPAPATPPVAVGFGLLLLPIGFALLALSRRRPTATAVGLAGANIAGAAVLGGWLLWRWQEFAGAGQVLTGVTSVALVLLALLELAGLRRAVKVPAALRRSESR